MRLEDMSVLEKADKLEELLTKVNLDNEYEITIAWRNNPEEDKKTAITTIENVRTMFREPQIDSLDEDVQAEAYTTYNTLLDNCLMMFPEYKNNDIITESIQSSMHI